MRIDHLDHLVLTVEDIDAAVAFYEGALGMEAVTFGNGRTALRFGRQKINLHLAGHEIEPKARAAAPGTADLCFICATPVAEVLARLEALGIRPELGPVRRTGAEGPLTSVYLRDPDGNLIELSNPA
ncbi:MAG: VOC family protein [Duodenibacillus sp.]|nr:VOC family protein [Duodenibacillus sp.]